MVRVERGGEGKGKGRERRQRKLRENTERQKEIMRPQKGRIFKYFPDNDNRNRGLRSSDGSACDSGPSLQLILEKRYRIGRLRDGLPCEFGIARYAVCLAYSIGAQIANANATKICNIDEVKRHSVFVYNVLFVHAIQEIR